MYSEEGGMVYTGAALRAVAMPLGGIGTGSVAICGDGGLRQWQLCNKVNHLGHVPHSFFGVWTKKGGLSPLSRVLMSDAQYDESSFTPSASVNDHVVPAGSRRLLERLPGVGEIRFTGAYPIAELEYLDGALPVAVWLEAFSPFAPLDPEDSGIPAVLFNFTVRNPDGAKPAWVSLLATLQNAVGWDGLSEIDGVRNPGYGGNGNAIASLRDLTALHMTNATLPPGHPQAGEMVLALRAPEADDQVSVVPQWADVDRLWADFAHDGLLTEPPPGVGRPSAPGTTWNGAIALRFKLEPGESRVVRFVLAWYFPNRYVDWDQGRMGFMDRKSAFWLGNAYSNRFDSALAVAEYVRDEGERLTELTRRFQGAFYDSTLPEALLDAAGSQISTLRTPTCLWLENGEFHGFEGCCGASTTHCAGAGCCPMDCTHVWNYEMTLAALFPSLERAMRETDLLVQMHPSGYIPHRTILPTYLPRAWDRPIGGPENPALDGMLGTVLKTYREVLRGAERAWFDRMWPRVKRLMHYVMTEHDVNGDGVIRGEQPNTYDISVYGANTFIGSLYLAALRAAEEMARLQDEDDLVGVYRERFETGRENLDAAVWNGEYWHQDVKLAVHPEHQWGVGCHSDQLLGQWWAHALGLGYVLPEEHVRRAVKSIFAYNWRTDFVDFGQKPRVFADESDSGLLNCTWPGSGRPGVPTLYSDEVWTGVEYAVAALLLFEGMVDEALTIVQGARARYDGTRRSPWNEVECGDHYVRPMSSWALLEAASGVRYDAIHKALTVTPRLAADELRCFFVAGEGWGRLSHIRDATQIDFKLEVYYGSLKLASVRFAWPDEQGVAGAIVKVNGAVSRAAWRREPGTVVVEPTRVLELKDGDALDVRLGG
jgi:non-lysosomal glucosylceramidase